MKSRFLKITFAAALAVVAGVTAYQAQDKEVMSDLALANVEALAGGELSGGFTKTTGNCPDPVSYKKWVSCKPGGPDECFASDC
ncbi:MULTISPECIES: NVEALA domain-containing protein [unclassified Bacteroides]|uniref:NVEALA domain-containing protein n=1 Tax=unclassified Bacteroides TaxID=2646097 RepID=UPI000B38B36D|nr:MULTISPECIES: NVEALA domain-containing protein [unclassified Bacteroides]OUN80032.1 hypothetical protein B5G04_10820 [Bacteroides sp. An51A]OUP26698.1 hypothetical protein B5F25_20085 [Bacteroides sp. An19]